MYQKEILNFIAVEQFIDIILVNPDLAIIFSPFINRYSVNLENNL
jgi:hypothetical protein